MSSSKRMEDPGGAYAWARPVSAKTWATSGSFRTRKKGSDRSAGFARLFGVVLAGKGKANYNGADGTVAAVYDRRYFVGFRKNRRSQSAATAEATGLRF